MVNPTITFDRFLATFVPGALVVFGGFYLHRPFLLRYFPYIAGDPELGSGTLVAPEWRVLLFSVLAICVGMILNQISDLTIAVLVKSEDRLAKSRRRYRKIVRALGFIFIFRPLVDVRQHILSRYLRSPRRGIFLRMLSAWGQGSEETLAQPGEAAIVHQHLVSRLRCLSEHSDRVLKEAFVPLYFASSLFAGALVLWIIALLAPLSASSVKTEFEVHETEVYVVLIAAALLHFPWILCSSIPPQQR